MQHSFYLSKNQHSSFTVVTPPQKKSFGERCNGNIYSHSPAIFRPWGMILCIMEVGLFTADGHEYS
jgi:hypothetical protein